MYLKNTKKIIHFKLLISLMELDINKVYHKYIIRMVIFSIFLHKREIRNPDLFKFNVLSFLNKRLPWKINLSIDTGIKLEKLEERNIFLDVLLNDTKTDYLSNVKVSFKTPIKEVSMVISLNDEEKYKEFIYK